MPTRYTPPGFGASPYGNSGPTGPTPGVTTVPGPTTITINPTTGAVTSVSSTLPNDSLDSAEYTPADNSTAATTTTATTATVSTGASWLTYGSIGLLLIGAWLLWKHFENRL